MSKSPRQKMREEEAEKSAKLPSLWKFLIYVPLFIAVVGGWLYVSGAFSSRMMGCTVELSYLDSFMSNLIGFAGALGLTATAFGFYFLENRK